jgi:hypothetical protein
MSTVGFELTIAAAIDLRLTSNIKFSHSSEYDEYGFTGFYAM